MGSLPINPQVNAVVADPRDPKNVYAAGPAGVFYSTDAGLTWTARFDGLDDAAIVALTLNPNQPDVLFAATADNRLFRSGDSGITWQVVTSSP